jgi:predicted ATP-dependent serine protease
MAMLNFVYGSEEYECLNKGHLLLFSGKRGSGKTTLMKDLINSCITGELKGVWKFNCDWRKVVHIDTEQPPDLLEKFKKDICTEGTYEVYALGDLLTPDNKLSRVIEIINGSEGGCMYIIDTLSDLAADPNDFNMASRISQNLSGLANRKDCIITVVAHNNAQDTVLGAVGKYIENKASSSFNISLDDNTGVSRVRNVKTRFDSIPDFSFTVDNNKNIELGVYIPFP